MRCFRALLSFFLFSNLASALIAFNASSRSPGAALVVSNPRQSDIVHKPCCTLDIIVGREQPGQDEIARLPVGSRVCLLAVHLLRLPQELLSSSSYPHQAVREELEPLSRECVLEALELERGIVLVNSTSATSTARKDHLWFRKRSHFNAPSLDEINFHLVRPKCAALVEKAREITRRVLPSSAPSLLPSIVVDSIAEGRRDHCNLQDETQRVLMLQMKDDRYRTGLLSFVATSMPPLLRRGLSRLDPDLGLFVPGHGHEAVLRTFVLLRPPQPTAWSPSLPLLPRSTAIVGKTLVLKTEDDAQEFLASLPETSPPPSLPSAYATLVYSDDYAKGIAAMALTLAASISEPSTLVVMVGCRPVEDLFAAVDDGDGDEGGDDGDGEQHALEWLRSQIRWDTENAAGDALCRPMVSEAWLRRLRALGRQMSPSSPAGASEPEPLSSVFSRVTATMRNGTGQFEAEGGGRDAAFSLSPLTIRLVFVPLLPRLRPGVSIIGLDSGVWMKLHAWAALAGRHSCAVMLDADVLVNRPLSHLFRLPVCDPAAAGAAGDDDAAAYSSPVVVDSAAGVAVELSDLEAGTFNVGLMVLRPSLRVWNGMLSSLLFAKPSPPSFQVVETTFLNHWFGNSGGDRAAWILPLNYWCVAETAQRYDQPWLCNTFDFSSCGGSKRFKPWQLLSSGDEDENGGEEKDDDDDGDGLVSLLPTVSACRGIGPPSARYVGLLRAWRRIYRLALRLMRRDDDAAAAA